MLSLRRRRRRRKLRFSPRIHRLKSVLDFGQDILVVLLFVCDLVGVLVLTNIIHDSLHDFPGNESWVRPDCYWVGNKN